MNVPDSLFIQPIGAKGHGLFVRSARAKGSVLFEFRGRLLPARLANSKSLQIGPGVMLESTEGFDDYLNHSCAPNCRIRFGKKITLVALRDIGISEELSFNYNWTEYDMRAEGCAFSCGCQSAECAGEIRGFKYLSLEQKIAMKPFLSPFLRQELRQELRQPIFSPRQPVPSFA